jgi:hypothetical protein
MRIIADSEDGYDTSLGVRRKISVKTVGHDNALKDHNDMDKTDDTDEPLTRWSWMSWQ